MSRDGRLHLFAPLSRRGFLRYGGSAAAVAGLDHLLPTYLRPGGGLHRGAQDVLNGSEGQIELTIAETEVEVDGRRARATTINGTLPAPLLRFREGDEAVIHVTNRLDEDSSIHWHGILLPNAMDGVPGVTFPGFGRAKRSRTSSRSVSTARTGTTAIRGFRSRRATTARW